MPQNPDSLHLQASINDTLRSPAVAIMQDSTHRHVRRRSQAFILDSLHRVASADSAALVAESAKAREDSIARANEPVIAKPVYVNLFQGHLLQPVHMQAQQRSGTNPDWFFPVLIFVISVYAGLNIFYRRYFRQMISAFVNNNITNQIVRDENVIVQRASVYLSLVFNIIAALFLYLISIHLDWDMGGIGHGFSRFLFFAILVSLIYALKFLALKISGWVFGLDREMAIYIFNIFLMNNVLGIVLVPVIALLAFNPDLPFQLLLVVAVVFISLAYLYRVGRGLITGMAIPGFSPLYLFLYLCTLEIGPLLVLLRVLRV